MPGRAPHQRAHHIVGAIRVRTPRQNRGSVHNIPRRPSQAEALLLSLSGPSSAAECRPSRENWPLTPGKPCSHGTRARYGTCTPACGAGTVRHWSPTTAPPIVADNGSPDNGPAAIDWLTGQVLNRDHGAHPCTPRCNRRRSGLHDPGCRGPTADTAKPSNVTGACTFEGVAECETWAATDTAPCSTQCRLPAIPRIACRTRECGCTRFAPPSCPRCAPSHQDSWCSAGLRSRRTHR